MVSIGRWVRAGLPAILIPVLWGLSGPVSAGEDLAADPPRGTFVWVPQNAEVTAPTPPPLAAGEPHILYLNRCVGGMTITAGWPDDNVLNRSGILGGTITLPEFGYGESAWQEVMTQTRQIFAPFNITVTDVDPSPAPHDEAIVCGSGSQAGFGGAGGVAPFSCGVIEKPITFTFADSLGGHPRTIAEVIAQEAAHAWGLEHEYKCEDPMTYLSGCGDKTYQDGDFPCGEFSPRSCDCGGSTQNSYQYILGLFGPAVPDAAEPSAAIVHPGDGSSFALGEDFDIQVQVSDDIGVTRVKLYLDGDVATEAVADPWGPWQASGLPEGTHDLYVEAFDAAGKSSSSDVVTVHITADGTPPPGSGSGGGGQGDGGGDGGDDGGDDGDGSGPGGGSDSGAYGDGDGDALPPGFGADGDLQGCACRSDGGRGTAPLGTGLVWGLLGLGWLVRRRGAGRASRPA